MPRLLKLELSEEERKELETIRDKHEKAYLRERAAALLKVAEGESGLQVAEHGLLKRRNADALYTWVHRYEAEGVNGLIIRAGRGRKPSFSPSAHERRERS